MITSFKKPDTFPVTVDANSPNQKSQVCMKKLSLTSVIGFCFSLLAVGEAKAENFIFTKIADTSAYTNISSPSINDNGTVAFRASDNTSSNIFTGNGGQLTNVYRLEIDPTFIGFFGSPAINNSGTIGFVAVTNRPRGAGAFIVKVGQSPTSIGTFSYTTGDGPSINNNGTLAFTGGNAPASVFIATAAQGGPSKTLFRGEVSSSELSDPSINNAGTVVFAGIPNNYPPFQQQLRLPYGIYTTSSRSDGNPVYKQVLVPNNTFSSFRNPTINDRGKIAFAASLNPEGEGVFTINRNGVQTKIADTSGQFNSFGAISLNNRGTLAFEAELDTGEKGIFVATNPVTDKVIAVGDSLNGATLSSVSLFSSGLNDSRQVAFFAKFTNGTSGIFRVNATTTQSLSGSESD